MRKSLLLLLTLTFVWFGAKSNTFVAATNTADPIVEQAYQSAFTHLNTTTVFGQFVRGMALAGTAPGCLTDIVVNQLANVNSCVADSIYWTEPVAEPTLTSPRDTVMINVKTGLVVLTSVPTPKIYNLAIGEYRVEYRYDIVSSPGVIGVCNVLLTITDTQKPSLDISGISTAVPAVNDTITVFTTDSTCATAANGANLVDPFAIKRPTVLDACDGSSLVSYVIKSAAGNTLGSDDTLTVAESNLAASLNDSILFPKGFNYIIFTAYDTTGNKSIDTLVVNVKDATFPIFTDSIAVSDTNIVGSSFGTDNLSTNVGSASRTVSYLIPTANDNCGVTSYSYVIINTGTLATVATGTGNNISATLPVGSYRLDYSASDASGNKETISHFIVVSDNEAPTVVCPNDEFDGPYFVSNTCEYNFATESVAGRDNFSTSLTNHWEVLDTDTAFVLNSGSKLNTFDNITATLTKAGRYAVRQWVTDNTKGALDLGYSSDTCIAFFSVRDTIVPVLDSKPVNISLNLGLGCDTTFAPKVPNVTENCTLDSTGFLITNNVNGDTLYLGNSAAGALTFSALIDETVNVIYNYSFFFRDKSGNVVSYNYSISVNDTVAPTINTDIFTAGTVNDTTVTILAGSCDAQFTIPSSRLISRVNDNCSVASIKNGNNELFNKNTMTVADVLVTLTDTLSTFYFTVTDYAGNSSTDSIIVRKVDSSFPILNGGTPYANIDEYNTINSCEYVYTVNRLNNVLQVSDNCGIDSVFITIDLGNNASIDTVIGFTPAQLLNPFSFGFPASQLNDGLNSQTHNVSVSARDISGNTTTSAFNVTVHDSIKPQIFLDDSVVYYVNGNDCNSVTILSSDPRADIFGNGLGSVYDNCADDVRLFANMTNNNPASAIAGDSLFGNFPLGTTTVTFTTNDGNGNSFSQSIDVIVVDTIAPNAVLSITNTTTSDSTCTAVIKLVSPVSISDDNCGVDSVEYSLDGITFIGLDSLNASFTNTYPLDTTTVFWRSYDSAGNFTEFSTKVVVKDLFKPVLNLNNSALVYYATANECARTVTLPAATVTENCGIDSVVSTLRTVQGTMDTTVRFVNTPVVADLLAVHFAFPATYTLTTIAYDVNGNVSNTLTNFITYSDTIKPTINAIDTVFLKTDTLLCTTTINLDSLGQAYGLGVDDNCGVNTLRYNFKNTPGSFKDTSFTAGIGTYDFEVNVIDNSLNFRKQGFTIVVESTFADKILSAPADTVSSNVFANECSKNVTFDSLVINTCGNRYAIVSSIASGSLFPIGYTDVAWYVIDNGDTLFTYNFVVNVIDNQAPVIRQAPQNITLYVGSDCSVQYNYVLDVQDNCDAQGLTVTTSVPSGSVLGVGTFTNTYSVADESGNTVGGSNVITVLDTITPGFSAFPSNIVTCDPIVNYTVTGSDNCAAPTTTLVSGPASGATFNLGVTTVTYTVTDASGNSATKSFTVEILPQATVADAGANADVCITSSFALAGNALVAGETGTWSVTPALASIADVNNPTTAVTFNTAAIYTFTWTVDNGQCAPNSDNVVVVVSDLALADAGADFTTDQTTVTLDGLSDNGSVVWTTTSTATIASPNNDRTQVTNLEEGANVFAFTVNNAICGNNSDTVIVTLEVLDVDFRKNIVGGFTPNGDGVNDTWTLPGIENYPNATVEIFNRYGSSIFETSTPATESWDGTNDGEILPVASYYYVIDLGDGSKQLKGIVSIIK